jgi:exopolysaccharide biosynthesis polyprenyl glycosylphosphotransferase
MYDNRAAELDRTILAWDIFLTVGIFILSFWGRRFLPLQGEVDFYSHIFLIPLLLVLIISFLTHFGAYALPRESSLFDYTWAVFRGVALAIGLLLSLLFFLKIQYISRYIIIIFASIEFFALTTIRIIVKSYYLKALKNGSCSLKVLIVGTGDRARFLAKQLKHHAELGFEIVGYLDPDPRQAGQTVEAIPVIGSVGNISECLKKHIIDEVIIAIPRSLLEDAEPIVQACEEEAIKLRFMADIFDLHVARISLHEIGKIPLLTLEPVAQDDTKLMFKRVFDFTITLFAMPFLLPIMTILAIAIKMESPGPIFFVQQRVGLRKHLFPMFKFRSMYEDAEQKMKEIEHLNEADGPIFKMTNDPRITQVGHFIRKTSLDELPQLLNVLRGEMSLVGPRPMSIRDVNLFNKGIQRKRFSVKPGITCIWQISGRSNLPFSQWLLLDLEYIENWSLSLDLKILLKTIPAVLKSKGAV